MQEVNIFKFSLADEILLQCQILTLRLSWMKASEQNLLFDDVLVLVMHADW